jgi:hypothetical protein
MCTYWCFYLSSSEARWAFLGVGHSEETFTVWLLWMGLGAELCDLSVTASHKSPSNRETEHTLTNQKRRAAYTYCLRESVSQGSERERTQRNKLDWVTGKLFTLRTKRCKIDSLAGNLEKEVMLPVSRVPPVTIPPLQARGGVHAFGQHGSGPQGLPHLP